MYRTPTIMYTNKGLTQISTMYYNKSEKTSSNSSSNITRTVTLHLPLFLTIPLWIRHGYSMKDIHTTLEISLKKASFPKLSLIIFE